jgi:hypothetical protein
MTQRALIEPPAKSGLCDCCGEPGILSEPACDRCGEGIAHFLCQDCFRAEKSGGLGTFCRRCEGACEYATGPCHVGGTSR